METSRILLLLIYAVAVLNSLFAAGHLLAGSGRRDLNRLLTGLVLMFTLRLSKTIGVFFLPDLHTLYHVVWFGVIALTGPLLFCYVERLRTAESGRRLLLHLAAPLHLIPILAVRPELMEIGAVYLVTLAYFVVYVTAACLRMISLLRTARPKPITRRWLQALLVLFATDALVLVASLVGRYPATDIEAVLFSFAIYGLVFAELRRRVIREVHGRALGDPVVDDGLAERIETVMRNDSAYLDANLTLAKLARSAGTAPHQLSRTLNEHFGQNFNDFVNGYRVAEAKRRLRTPEGRSMTIAAVAHECGFNSLSVFNPAFKRLTGMTPSQYQSGD